MLADATARPAAGRSRFPQLPPPPKARDNAPRAQLAALSAGGGAALVPSTTPPEPCMSSY